MRVFFAGIQAKPERESLIISTTLFELVPASTYSRDGQELYRAVGVSAAHTADWCYSYAPPPAWARKTVVFCKIISVKILQHEPGVFN